jgi:tetratricopeptide repeat protein 30
VLANLCVSYIMTSQNEAAERVLRSVERAEEARLAEAARRSGGSGGSSSGGSLRSSCLHAPTFHLCIINLVICTLYCAKGNTEFGVSRVLRALEPASRKLGADTWYYAKRVLLHLGCQLAKGMLTVKDATFADVLGTLDAAELHGAKLPAVLAPPSAAEEALQEAPRTIAQEARALKRLFLKLREKS